MRFRLRHIISSVAAFALSVEGAAAHCPLCTIGAVAAAGGAAYFGVNKAIIGIFIGAFAASMGWWIAGLIRKQYFKFQRAALVIFSYLTTVIPMMPLMKESTPYPVYIMLFGGYGTLLNRTYLFDLFFVGSLIGLGIVSTAPWLSKKMTEARKGKMFPYQGMAITFGLLLIASLIMQFAL